MQWDRLDEVAEVIEPMLRAARDTGTQVIWDLMHYGWPGYIDIWKPGFPERFADYARNYLGDGKKDAALDAIITLRLPWWSTRLPNQMPRPAVRAR